MLRTHTIIFKPQLFTFLIMLLLSGKFTMYILYIAVMVLHIIVVIIILMITVVLSL